MPFTPTTPEAGEIPAAPVAQDKTTIHVTCIRIEKEPESTEPSVYVEWQEGYMDGENFVMIDIGKNGYVATPSSVLETIMSGSPSGSSVYDVIKNAIYQLLQDDSKIPAGTVS
jgi:hypothetical protein